MPRILIADDDPQLRRALQRALVKLGYEVSEAHDGLHAQTVLREAPCDLVISDLQMPVADGMALLRYVRRELPDVPVIILTGNSSLEAGLSAMQQGAAHFLGKPFAAAELKRVVEDTLAGRGQPVLLGESRPMRRAVELIEQSAQSTAPALILGEEGIGADTIARLTHGLSPNADGPFVVLRTAAASGDAMKDALVALITEARGGTLFIDALDALSPTAQDLLFHDLSTPAEPAQKAPRVIAALHTGTSEAIARGALREDLIALFRTCIEIPALRERPGDVPTLARYFLQAANRRAGRHATLSESALGALRVHRWPGNLVELEQMIEGLVRSSDEPPSRPLHAADEDANDGSEYRVPITRLAAQILLATGTRGDVALFLPRAEDVALFLEEEGAFVPIEEHGRVRVYARAAIACVSTRHAGPASEEDLVMTTRKVTVRMRHGSTFHGELRYDAAVPQARVVDFLNTPARSFTLFSEDMVHRIAKAHVESVEESK